MAIQISGTNVIDNDRNLTNTVNITASGTISGDIVATQAQAETGTDNTKLMTPLRVAEAITALGGQVINRIQRGSTSLATTAPPGPPLAAEAPVTTNVPITSVDTAKSMISQGNRGNFGPAAVAGSGSARLTTSTNVAVTTGSGGPPSSAAPNSTTVDWEVIEFK
jgi:hypothetical protein